MRKKNLLPPGLRTVIYACTELAGVVRDVVRLLAASVTKK